MKNLKVFICAMLLVLGITTIAGAAPTYVYDGGLGTWSDVNKTSVIGNPDSLLCWAASASNALAWTGWRGWDSGTSTYISTTAAIYAQFDAGWGNHTGSAIYAYEWWMTDHTTANSNFGETLDSQGKNFYPGVVSDPHLAGSVVNFVQDGVANQIYNFLGTYINDDRGIVASIDVPNGPGQIGPYSHAVTVWGWDPTLNLIYITDSDDGVMALQTYSFFQLGVGGEVYIDNYTNLYTQATDVQITELVRLNRNSTGIEPNRPTGPDGQIPEPTTILLIGSGLIGLWGFRKKFKK